MLDPSNLTRRKAYKTRVKGIWRCVENVNTQKNEIVKSALFSAYKGKFIEGRVRKSLIHYAAWFLRLKKILHH